ncbi:MAG TPA: hypothetical protein VHC98_00915 [Candidatus Saccharimonadales bacterium]|nr:hypothetical protein [Candidatus Saccharimonadales bacterium]
MKKLHHILAVGFVLTSCGLLSCAPFAMAATTTSNPGSGQALEIAPPLITLTANPGQTLKTNIELRDVADTSLLVTNEINDFVANGEDGTPKILTGDDSNNPYTLKAWVTPLQAITLQPHQIETLPVTISVPTTAAPGGHYGVIRFSGTPPNLKGQGVSLSASIGALVLLTVNGKLTEHMSVQEFSVNGGNGKAGSLFEATPLTFVVRLKNSGNVQEEPTGYATITDMFGKPVAGVNINVPPRNVLPDSIRRFTGMLDKSVIGDKHLFGRYHAVLKMTYGTTSKQTLTASVYFWVIPYRLIGIVVAALIIGFFLLAFLIKRYNRHIIARSQTRRR